ncbi:MAG: PDDEXK nuclease domain-containing protein [Bacteroidales bacterium]|nr:PDDEXK nuclease domain-containing protein [Bacteroidales bacterium]
MSQEIEKSKRESQLYEKIEKLIVLAHQRVVSSVNLIMVHTYFGIGQYIIEDEQQGMLRADYGDKTLKGISEKLSAKFGKGYSERNLRNMRQFFLTYQERAIWQTASARLQTTENKDIEISHRPSSEPQIQDVPSQKFNNLSLSWSHYLILMRIENPDERSFYEIEANNQHWSERQLQRQYNSSLYERLALSRDKEKVMQLATEGHQVEEPTDLLKNPLTLEFLGLSESSVYSETDLETAIISKLQLFLLELGKGFLFESRQKRFTFDEEHFFVDLVFYNRLLQCYVLIDLKTNKLKHQDLGQMQMYVNYYDRYVKLPNEKPTIGILLCKEKKDTLVELTLPHDTKIYASEYKFYLPDKQLLKQKLREWIDEFEKRKGEEA